MDEVWKNIDLNYQVSNLGNVKSVDRIVVRTDGRKQPRIGKMLKQNININGYKVVKIYQKWKYVHRLIAEQFIPNSDNLPIIDHKDGNKTNNDINNLRWCNHKQNQYNRKQQKSKSGIKNVQLCVRKTITYYQVRFNVDGKNKYFGTFNNFKDAEEKAKQIRQELHKDFKNDGNLQVE